jgi:hypothetical protein
MTVNEYFKYWRPAKAVVLPNYINSDLRSLEIEASVKLGKLLGIWYPDPGSWPINCVNR